MPTPNTETYTVDGLTFAIQVGPDDRLAAIMIDDANAGSNLDQQIAALVECLTRWRSHQVVVPVAGKTYVAPNGAHYLCTETGDLVNLTPPHVGDVLKQEQQPVWTKQTLKALHLTITTEPRYAFDGLYYQYNPQVSGPGDPDTWWRRSNGGWEPRWPRTGDVAVADGEPLWADVIMMPVETA